MMLTLDDLKGIEYVIDASGKRTKAIVPIDELEEWMVDVEMAAAARDVDADDLIPWEQVKAELIASGKIDA